MSNEDRKQVCNVSNAVDNVLCSVRCRGWQTAKTSRSSFGWLCDRREDGIPVMGSLNPDEEPLLSSVVSSEKRTDLRRSRQNNRMLFVRSFFPPAFRTFRRNSDDRQPDRRRARVRCNTTAGRYLLGVVKTISELLAGVYARSRKSEQIKTR